MGGGKNFNLYPIAVAGSSTSIYACVLAASCMHPYYTTLHYTELLPHGVCTVACEVAWHNGHRVTAACGTDMVIKFLSLLLLSGLFAQSNLPLLISLDLFDLCRCGQGTRTMAPKSRVAVSEVRCCLAGSHRSPRNCLAREGRGGEG